jgi:hypothetical protein
MSASSQDQYQEAIFSQLAHNALMLNQLTGVENDSTLDQELTALQGADLSALEADLERLKLKISRIEAKLRIMKWVVWAIAIGVMIDLFQRPLGAFVHLGWAWMGF